MPKNPKKEKDLFASRCYQLLRRVPAGKVTSYKEIARALGSKAYRAVGSAMSKNPWLVEIPCHRVIKSNGEVGGYAGGREEKIRLLQGEGVEVEAGRVRGLEKYFVYLGPPWE